TDARCAKLKGVVCVRLCASNEHQLKVTLPLGKAARATRAVRSGTSPIRPGFRDTEAPRGGGRHDVSHFSIAVCRPAMNSSTVSDRFLYSIVSIDCIIHNYYSIAITSPLADTSTSRTLPRLSLPRTS